MSVPDAARPSPTLLGRIDDACDAFEAAWKAGAAPRIEGFLGRVPEPDRPALLRELVALELELRRRRGERPGPAEYRDRFPGHEGAIASAFDATTAAPAAGADPAPALMFGVLALRDGVADARAVRVALADWVADPSRSLGEILVARGLLAGAQRDRLDALADSFLRQAGAAPAGPSTLGSEDPPGPGPVPPGSATVAETITHGAPRRVASAAPATIPAGPRYRVIRPHARGGLGEVFVAEDAELHREVALKEIQGRHADDPDSRARFLFEAQVTGGLEHPGIVPVYALGFHADGRPYYTMRFIRGETLREAIDRFHAQDAPETQPGERALAFRDLLGRFVAVCHAVAYAHSRGVLHRDLKPANIMLGPYGETLVLDWGLAKPVGGPASGELSGEPLRPPSASGSAVTVAGSAVGTPAFMSPEQAAGDLDRLGPASDIYSLGATLYCLLTGRGPFEGRDVATVLDRVRRGDFPPPRQVHRTVPPALEAVCLKAMAARPEGRYASAEDLAHDIEHWLADEPVSAYREPTPVRLGRWARRHRTWVVGGSALLLTAVVALAIGALLLEGSRRRERQQRQIAQKAQAEASARARAERVARAEESRQRGLAQEARLRAEEQFYLSDVALAGREWAAGQAARAIDLLNQAPLARRAWEWHYLKRQTDTARQNLAGEHVGTITGLAFTPDGARLLSGGWHGTLKLWDAATGRAVRALGAGGDGHPGHVTDVACQPDGKRLASAGDDGTVRLWDAASGALVRTIAAHPGGASAVAFRPDGTLLASAGLDGIVRLWDPDTGEGRGSRRGHTAGVVALAFSRDGTRLATGGLAPDAAIRVWDVNDEAAEPIILRGHRGAVHGVAFAPDGRTIASAGDDGDVRLWDAGAGGPPRTTLRGPGRPLLGLVYSPDGTRLAAVGLDQCLLVWDAASGRLLATRRGHLAGLHALAFRPDGRVVATAGDDTVVKLWATDEPGDAIRPEGASGALAGLAFHPDRRRVAAADGAIVRTWDAATGREGPAFRGHEADVAALAFGPDSTRLASADVGGTVIVWEVATARVLHRLDGPLPDTRPGTPGAGLLVGFAAGGRHVVCAGTEGRAVVWEVADGREVRSFRLRRPPQLFGLAGVDALTALALAPDGALLAAGGFDGTVQLVDVATGREVGTLPGDYAVISGLAFSADGARLASVSSREATGSSEVRLWDVTARRALHTLTGPAGMTVPLAFSRDGARLAIADAEGRVTLFDAETGWEVLRLPLHTDAPRTAVDAVAFSPDGHRLAASGLHGLLVWDATPGREAYVFRHPDLVHALAYSPDGTRLASSSGKTIRIQDAADGRDLLALAPPGAPAAIVWTGLAYSPDGARVAAGDAAGKVVVWEAATGRVVAVLEGHAGPVIGLAFGPDGRRLATASHDKTARLWDVDRSRILHVFRQHTDRVNTVAFGRDGTLVISAGRDGTVRLWDAASGREEAVLRGHRGSIAAIAVSPDGRRLASVGGRSAASAEGAPEGECRLWDLSRRAEVAALPDADTYLRAVAFRPDGRELATGGEDGRIRFWSVATRGEPLTLPAHDGMVLRVAYHPSGAFLASAGYDRRVRVWDLRPTPAP